MITVFRELILKIIAGIIGIWLAAQFVSGVEITDSWQIFIWAGLILGLINYFIKPILNLIALPLRIITLGLFSLVINMGIIWTIDVLFPEIDIKGIVPLFWTTLIVWTINLIIPKFFPKKKTIIEN
ncbi:MAG: phage holin family protein [Minisyncoccales bacterium]